MKPIEKNICKKVVIYYFSGTGNAKNVGKWIDQEAQRKNISSELIDISKLRSRKEIKVPEEAMIGFCSPTHGFNFPPIMFHFLLQFPKSKRNKCFIINTRAGMKMGKMFLPGLSGMAQYFTALILKLKGYKIVGMHPIDLPSNWISFHPGIKKNVVDSIFERRKKETEKMAFKLISGKKDLRAYKHLIQDLAITPIAFIYYLIGRFVLAKSFYASRNCAKCDLCIKNCPIKAIKTIDNRPFWTYKCESCMRCMNICPERAIETSHGYTIGIYYLISSFVIVKLYKFLGINNFLNEVFPEWLVKVFKFSINSVIIVLLIISFYRIFHFLLRFRIFERLIVYSSLTKWKFWRRYKIS